MSSTLDAEFGPIRSLVWPIYRNEVRKVVPTLIMLFFIVICYTILRNMKDALVVTASGAEVIPFLKVWVILPAAVFMTLGFTWLSNHFSQERVFYILISGFLLSYALFAFVLYPMRDALHPHELADRLELILPAGFKGLVSMLRNWTFTGFYVMSEMWSPMILTVLFWGFANEITSLKEAPRFYCVLGIVANTATTLSGQLAVLVSAMDYQAFLPFGTTAWEQQLTLLVIIVIASGLITMAVFRWMNKNVLNDPSFEALHRRSGKMLFKGKKKKLSLRESFTFLSNSKYLICIAIVVVSYNLSINMVEVVWKDRLRTLYPNPSDFNTYMNNLTSAIGVVSTVMALFMAKIIHYLGWTRTALVTPVIMMITCAGFFSFMFFQDHLGWIVTFIGITPLAIAVMFGGAQNCFSKAMKYSVFDATKEMAYIPLPHDVKLKGKAAIDGVGSRLGKSGGSLIHQGLLMTFGTLAASAPIVAGILAIVIVLWVFAVRVLGVQFNELTAEQPQAETDAEVEQPHVSVVHTDPHSDGPAVARAL